MQHFVISFFFCFVLFLPYSYKIESSVRYIVLYDTYIFLFLSFSSNNKIRNHFKSYLQQNLCTRSFKARHTNMIHSMWRLNSIPQNILACFCGESSFLFEPSKQEAIDWYLVFSPIFVGSTGRGLCSSNGILYPTSHKGTFCLFIETLRYQPYDSRTFKSMRK